MAQHAEYLQGSAVPVSAARFGDPSGSDRAAADEDVRQHKAGPTEGAEAGRPRPVLTSSESVPVPHAFQAIQPSVRRPAIGLRGRADAQRLVYHTIPAWADVRQQHAANLRPDSASRSAVILNPT